ncbi:MAG: riboflavin synthase [Bacteroidetes bacterium]|nr:riboflavin synthase [Bacteroidota bacterium]
MFTGLIEEIGKITKISNIPGGKTLHISANNILDDLKIDDSVAVNGVCLTATKLSGNGFWADAVGATLEKTTLATIRENFSVNLERSVRLMDRLGGHLVQGHVNGIAKISQINKLGDNYFLEVAIPEGLKKYVIDEGSISIDGISLTIAKLNGIKVGVSVIPHTWKSTTLCKNKIGDNVNIETDVIAKYIEKLLLSNTDEDKSKFSDDWFKKMGYLK